MSTEQPTPPTGPEQARGPEAGGPATAPTPEPRSRQADRSGQASSHDPLRGSRTSGTWIAVLVLVVVLILLAVFILQNTQSVEVSYFGWDGSAPLSATLLIAAAGGALIVAAAGALRILQLRRRIKRELKGR